MTVGSSSDQVTELASRLRHLIGIEDIHSPRNGLLLFRRIEWSCDNSRAFFVRDPMGNWVYKLLDQSLHDVQLIDTFVELHSASKDPNKGIEVSTLGGIRSFCCLFMVNKPGLHPATGTMYAPTSPGNSSKHQHFW